MRKTSSHGGRNRELPPQPGAPAATLSPRAARAARVTPVTSARADARERARDRRALTRRAWYGRASLLARPKAADLVRACRSIWYGRTRSRAAARRPLECARGGSSSAGSSRGRSSARVALRPRVGELRRPALRCEPAALRVSRAGSFGTAVPLLGAQPAGWSVALFGLTIGPSRPGETRASKQVVRPSAS